MSRERKVINVEQWPNAQSSLGGELSERKKNISSQKRIYSEASFLAKLTFIARETNYEIVRA